MYDSQGYPIAKTARAIFTVNELLTCLITITSASAVSMTLPTGTDTHTGMVGGNVGTLVIDQGFEWTIINLGNTSGAATLVASTNHTTVGSMVIAIGTSARFMTRCTAQNVVITYRLC